MIVLPTVFYPATDTILLIETVLNENIITEKSIVLEPCAGTGVISLFLAEKAQRVVATDINKLAIKNIIVNSQKYNLFHKIIAMNADVFPALSLKYDLIVINPPYTDKEAGDDVERAFWDKGHNTVRKLLNEGRTYLSAEGKIYLSWANFADFYFIEHLAAEEGYEIVLKAERVKEEKIYRVYELKPCNSKSR